MIIPLEGVRSGGNRPSGRATICPVQGVVPGMITEAATGAATPRAGKGGGEMAGTRPDFDDFVAARSSALLRTAYLLTHDHALAEDLLQTALTKAWFAWSRIDGDPGGYVRKVLVNTYASWWRRRWNGEHATEELPESTGPDATDGVGATHDQIGRAHV